MTVEPTELIEIFICYAREDEEYRQGLEKQLRILRRQGLITIWHDREIVPGTEWQQEIDKHLKSAQIILLLVSPDFMDSDYCYGIEMQNAMVRHRRGEAHVIPIIVHHVYWQEAPFGKLQVLPTDARPITDHSWYNLNEAFFNVAVGIREVIEKVKEERQRKLREELLRLAKVDEARRIAEREAKRIAEIAEEDRQRKLREEQLRLAEVEQSPPTPNYYPPNYYPPIMPIETDNTYMIARRLDRANNFAGIGCASLIVEALLTSIIIYMVGNWGWIPIIIASVLIIISLSFFIYWVKRWAKLKTEAEFEIPIKQTRNL